MWAHEASDFTPWLAANIEILSDAIGLPLTVVGQEVHIGEFRLDIHAVDPDDNTVIIENQLTPATTCTSGNCWSTPAGCKPRPRCGLPPGSATSIAAR